MQSDTFFGRVIHDPYRWLEDQQSDETTEWVKQQNAVTRAYLDKIPNSFTLREQIKRNTEIYELTPTKKGNYYFEFRTQFGGKDLHVYYKKDYLKDPWEELFITKGLGVGKNEAIHISEFEVSKDSRYLAYAYDNNGSDWKEIKIADLEKQRSLDDHLVDVKHTSIVWRDNGFYYIKYERQANDEYKQIMANAKLYYHVLGTTQDKDSLIFKKNDAHGNIFVPMVSEWGRYLIVSDVDLVKNTYAYYYHDFENKSQPGFLPLFKKSTKFFKYLGDKNDSLLFLVYVKNERKVISVDPKNPLKWVEEIKNVGGLLIKDVEYYRNKFYALCYYNQQEVIVVINNKGAIIKKVELPFGSSAKFKGIDETSNQLLLSYESYLHPAIYAGIDLTTFKFELLEKAKISYDMSEFVTEKVMYASDTAMVPMLLIHKKNMKMDGNNPVLLEFYGGFDKIKDADYDAGRISFLENGGIYAFAMIRGGGEKGHYWHLDGIGANKQKSINDVINAAVFLITHKYTSSSRLAISGGSNGGMIAGAVAMQRPELFAAAIPIVGVHDMIRFDKFTAGISWRDEFGSVADSLMFLNLMSYSPLHNVKKDIKYPAMLIMTSDYDDRVPPLHSYKFAAALQSMASKENPVLLRVEKNAGHNGARTYDKYIDQSTDFYGFILNALGIKKYN